jgi:hypothetical protein
LTEIGNELVPLLRVRTPGAMEQRAEFAAAVVEIWTDARRAVGSTTPEVVALEGAARVEYDLALWQLDHNYLEQVPEWLTLAEQHARAGRMAVYTTACATLRAALAERVRARERYVTLAEAVAAHPDDAKANAALATHLLAGLRDVERAAEPAERSGDAELRAVAAAWKENRALGPRRLAVGMALAALAERPGGNGGEKGALMSLAVEYLDAYARRAHPRDPDFTKARLHLSRLRPLAEAAVAARPVPPPVASIPRQATPDTPRATGANGGTASGGGANSGARAGAAGAGSRSGSPGTPMAVGSPPRRTAPIPAAPPRGGLGAVQPIAIDAAARRVVFVIDGTGSMMSRFEEAQAAVGRAIADLKPGQSFNCVFFAEGDVAAFQKGPVAATDANKASFVGYLRRLSPHGAADPTAALRLAFTQGADTVYLVTDGDFPNSAQVLPEIRRLNTGHRATIHTIGAIEADDPMERLVRAIAEEGGGTFRYLIEPRRR